MRFVNTTPGSALYSEDKILVDELRRRLGYQIPSRYDTDFNLYRWLLHADRSSKTRENLLVVAERGLRTHLRYRKSLCLDSEPIPCWQDNPLYLDRLMPRPTFLGVDKQNRLAATTQYRTLHMEGIMLKMRSSEMLMYHFWWLEEAVRLVNEQEDLSGKMSGVHIVMNLDGYNMNPFIMLFISNGAMGYYTQLFHYEQYPEVFAPIDLIHAAKWMALPYRLLKSLMPHGFTDRFRVFDNNYPDTFQKEFGWMGLPPALTENDPIHCARTIPKEEYWTPGSDDLYPKSPDEMTTLVVGPRRRKLVPVDVTWPNTRLQWYFLTDGEVQFGIFFNRKYRLNRDLDQDAHADIDMMEMVFPWFRLAGKLVPEMGHILCEKPGVYYLVFCNKGSWLSRKTVKLKLDTGAGVVKKQCLERTFSL